MDEIKIVVQDDKIIWYNSKDQMHREDGPAMIWGQTKYWYINGVKHRFGAPAVVHADGSKEWYLGGKRHRLDGPAIEKSNGEQYWFINGKQYSQDEFYVMNENRTVLLNIDGRDVRVSANTFHKMRDSFS